MNTITKVQERGFTLIELLAVMAILAVLAGMVAPTISGTKEASIDAKVLQDATQVRNASTNYFKDRTGSEVRTPHTVTVTPLVGGVSVSNVQQLVSDRWPEVFITSAASAPTNVVTIGTRYAHIFPTTNTIVSEVALLDHDGAVLAGDSLIRGFTAVDLEKLRDGNYLAGIPEGARAQSAANGGLDNFLWLFKKASSVGSEGDDRRVAVFKLVKIEKLESLTVTDTASPDFGKQKVRLTYKQVL